MLADIYKSEESIGGLPINMNGFHLFDEEHRSSYPLNIAYKAAQLVDNENADIFLYNLRHATVLDTRHTCISMLAEAHVDPTMIKKIVGHSGAMSFTEKVYTQLDIQSLVEAINKI